MIWQILFRRPCVYWLWFTPVPSFAVGVLAVAAVVMGARNQQEALEKTLWIFLAALLFFIDTRAVRADRATNDEKHAASLREERQQFQKLLESGQASFQKILTSQQQSFLEQQDSFAEVLRQTSSTLSQTLTTLRQVTGDPNTSAVYLAS